MRQRSRTEGAAFPTASQPVRRRGSRPPRDGAGRGPQQRVQGRGLELQPRGVSCGAPVHAWRQRPGTRRVCSAPCRQEACLHLVREGDLVSALPGGRERGAQAGAQLTRGADLQETRGPPSVCPVSAREDLPQASSTRYKTVRRGRYRGQGRCPGSPLC